MLTTTFVQVFSLVFYSNLTLIYYYQMISLQSTYCLEYRSTHKINRVLTAGYRCKVQLDTSQKTVTGSPLFVVFQYLVTLQYFRGYSNGGSLLDT